MRQGWSRYGRIARLWRTVALLGAVTLVGAALPLQAQIGGSAASQDDGAVRTFRAARAMVLAGGTIDDATASFFRAAVQAATVGDRAMQVASLRAAADLLSIKRPCTDSAAQVLRTALAAAGPGDRSAADALVRLLALRGNVTEARQILVAAYSDVPSLGRAITRESMRYLHGQAAIEFADGHEAAALSALNQALMFAARLHQGGVGDTIAKPSGAVDVVNAWILFDLAVVRLNAKSPSVRQPATGSGIMDLLLAAPATVLNGNDEEAYPVTRLADRLLLQGRSRGSTAPVQRGCATAFR